MSQFEQLTLKTTRTQLQAGLPARLLQGHRLFYYAVIRDPKSGRSVTVPAGGSRAPTSAWILSGVRPVNLGAHRFGHVRAPDAVVAQVGGTEVAWQGEGDPFGPQTFLVGRDGTIYLDDGLNNRLLVFRKGAPETVARTIALPSGSADSDVALGPNFRSVVIWSPKDSAFICIEPMAGITDALNLAQKGIYKELQTIAPGQTWRESFWIKPSSPAPL